MSESDWRPIGDVLKGLSYDWESRVTPAQRKMVDELFDVLAAWEEGLPVEEAAKLAFDGWFRFKVMRLVVGNDDLRRRLVAFVTALDDLSSVRSSNPGFRDPRGVWVDKATIAAHDGVASYDDRGRIVAATFPADVEGGTAVWPTEWRQRQAGLPRIRTHGQDPERAGKREESVSEYEDLWFPKDASP